MKCEELVPRGRIELPTSSLPMTTAASLGFLNAQCIHMKPSDNPKAI